MLALLYSQVTIIVGYLDELLREHLAQVLSNNVA